MARYVGSGCVRCRGKERVRLRGLRDVSNPFALAEEKFKKLFRVPNTSAQYLCELLNDHPSLNACDNIPKHLKILGSLHFYTDGGYQTADGGDSLIALSQPSMSRAIEEATTAIIDILAPQYIKFPMSPEEKQKTMNEFQEMYNMPNVLGAIDGTHIAIFKPPNNDPVAPGVIFFNRKGYYSINCQAVTNARGRIISLNPNFPGSTHDSAVWRASALALHMEREYLQGMQDQLLLGDKGYPLLPWLMTPVSEPETDEEQNYNDAHTRARNTVEMAFGRLKNKFRCLHKNRTLHYEPTKAAKIAIACCTLYNMFWDVLSDGESEDDDNADEDDGENNDIDPTNNERPDYLSMARAKRETLIELFR